MSEETKNATVSAPKGILYTVIATALDGFLIILVNRFYISIRLFIN